MKAKFVFSNAFISWVMALKTLFPMVNSHRFVNESSYTVILDHTTHTEQVSSGHINSHAWIGASELYN